MGEIEQNNRNLYKILSSAIRRDIREVRAEVKEAENIIKRQKMISDDPLYSGDDFLASLTAIKDYPVDEAFRKKEFLLLKGFISELKQRQNKPYGLIILITGIISTITLFYVKGSIGLLMIPLTLIAIIVYHAMS